MVTSQESGRKTKAKAPARFGARLMPERKELLERAAAIQGRSLTDFVMTSAEEAALRTIRDHEVLQLTVRDSKAFVSAVLEGAAPGKRLRKAAARYKAATAAEA